MSESELADGWSDGKEKEEERERNRKIYEERLDRD